MKALKLIAWLSALVVVGAPAATIAVLWSDASAAISRATEARIIPGQTSNAPLSRAESIVALIEFGETWKTHGAPCRSVEAVWDVLAGQRLSGPDVSGTLAESILMELTPERSLRQQFRKVLVACQLEQAYTDEQMLRMWLSRAYFGRETFGIENAAYSIFNKSVDHLNTDEAARLAALLRAPRLRDYPDRWAERARLIAERAAAHDANARP